MSIYFSLSLHPGPGIVIVVTSTNNNVHAGVERAHWRDISRRTKYGRHFDASSAGERWSSNGEWLHSKLVIHSNRSKAYDEEKWVRQRNAQLKEWKKYAARMDLVQINVTQWVAAVWLVRRLCNVFLSFGGAKEAKRTLPKCMHRKQHTYWQTRWKEKNQQQKPHTNRSRMTYRLQTTT